MSHPNPERDERVRQIRERQLRRGRSTDADLNVPRTEKEDIDYLLSLLDGQATEKEFAARTPIGIQIANHAATRMRDRCVQELKEMRDEWESKRNKQEPLSKMRNRYDAAFCAANEIITALQSLTLEGEQKQ